MKKILLAVFALGTIASANAQAPKEGSILIYGNVGFHSAKSSFDPGSAGVATSEAKTTSFNINPGIGYQFNKNWTVGLNVGYMHSKMEDGDTTSGIGKNNDFQIGPFIRYTKMLNHRFFIFNQLNLNYLSGKRLTEFNAPMPNFENSYNGFGAEWYPAIGVSVNKCIALNFSFGGLNYSHVTWDLDASPAEVKESNFDFTFGRQVNIGLSVNIGHRRHFGNAEPGMERRRINTSDDDTSGSGDGE